MVIVAVKIIMSSRARKLWISLRTAPASATKAAPPVSSYQIMSYQFAM